jgi:hypothetical protein
MLCTRVLWVWDAISNKHAFLSRLQPNKSLDASGGSVFRNWLGAAQGALNRAAASTQPLGFFIVSSAHCEGSILNRVSSYVRSLPKGDFYFLISLSLLSVCLSQVSFYLHLRSLRSFLMHTIAEGTANLPTASIMGWVEELVFRTRISISLLVMTVGLCSRTAWGFAISTVALVMTWLTFWRWENWIRARDWTGHGHAFTDLAGLGTMTTLAVLTVMLVVIITRLIRAVSSTRET